MLIWNAHAYSFISATAYQQQDNRYPNAYAQPEYNTTQYGTSSDYNNTSSSDYTQTGAYDNRSYSGYGEYNLKLVRTGEKNIFGKFDVLFTPAETIWFLSTSFNKIQMI